MKPLPDETPMRDRVLEAIRAFPGIHIRGLVRQLGTSLALVQYHVRLLEQEGVIRSTHAANFVRFFPKESFRELSPKDRALLHLIRQERPLEIILALLEFGRLQHRDLLEVVGGSKPALSYHLDRLVEAGIVERVAKGEEKGFSLKDPDRARALLTRFEPVSDVPARVAETWEDLFHGHRKRPPTEED